MEITLQQVLSKIEQADDYEISEIMSAVRNRFAAAFPDWEAFYLSCPKNDPVQRKQTLDYLLEYLQT